VACIVKTTRTPSTSTAGLTLNEDGSLSVLTSTVEIGQGSRTVLGQIAADAVGVTYDVVNVAYPDTATTPWDETTSSSRSTLMMGDAVRTAGERIRGQLLDLAAGALEAATTDLRIEDGRITIAGSPARSIEVAEVVRQSRLGNLLAYATSQTEGSLDPQTGQGVVTPNFSQAAAGAQVEVDLETGTVRLLDLRSETWAGRVINPVLAELQGEGNMAFGVGQALFEEIVLDAGQIVNPSLADYQLPSILDMGPSWSAGIHEASDGTGRVHGLGEAAAAAVPAAIGKMGTSPAPSATRRLVPSPPCVISTRTLA
jgi:CO/xanthine dehydrogenase Mo-binding subunit